MKRKHAKKAPAKKPAKKVAKKTTAKPGNSDGLGASITVRLAPAQVEQLDSAAKRFAVLHLSRSAIARQALRLGLDLIEGEGADALTRTVSETAR